MPKSNPNAKVTFSIGKSTSQESLLNSTPGCGTTTTTATNGNSSKVGDESVTDGDLESSPYTNGAKNNTNNNNNDNSTNNGAADENVDEFKDTSLRSSSTASLHHQSSSSVLAARRLSRKLSEQRDYIIVSSPEEFVQKYDGNRMIKTVLIANNGIAAVKCMRSIRRWSYEVFRNERAIKFAIM